MRPNLVLLARSLAGLAVLGWGWYIVGNFRTQQFGFSPAVLGVAAVFVLPAAVVPFAGLRWRTAALGASALLLAAVGTVEILAAREEAEFRRTHRRLPADAPLVFQERNWPFADHHLYHDPRSGRWGGGD